MRFCNNIALISGAGSGIGRATAQIIGAEGGTVVGVDVNREALDQIMSGVRQAGGRARGVVADALHAEQVQQSVQQTVDEFGRIDILVNAVGGSTIIPISPPYMTCARSRLFDQNVHHHGLCPQQLLAV